MGQIIIPTDKKINGPWLLDKNNLDELNEALVVIEEKIVDVYNILVDKKAESKIEEYRNLGRKIDIDKARQEIKESYSFDKSEKFVLVKTKQGKQIKDDNLSSLLKSSQIDEFNPIELRIHIQKGPCEFTLNVTTKYNGELETRIKILDETYFYDINYEISKWIERHKPNLATQTWSSWFPYTAILIFLVTTFFSLKLVSSKGDIYNIELDNQISLLLKDGLTETETTKAIEMILQRESGYIPETFNPEIPLNKTLKWIWIYSFITTLILSIVPRTIIGLGKNKWKFYIYKKWSYIVLVYIPGSIISILFSKLF
jgi:hypothetical protein